MPPQPGGAHPDFSPTLPDRRCHAGEVFFPTAPCSSATRGRCCSRPQKQTPCSRRCAPHPAPELWEERDAQDCCCCGIADGSRWERNGELGDTGGGRYGAQRVPGGTWPWLQEASSTSPGITRPWGKFGRPCQGLAEVVFRDGKGDIHLQISHGDFRSKGACARGASTNRVGRGVGTCWFGKTSSSCHHCGAES